MNYLRSTLYKDFYYCALLRQRILRLPIGVQRACLMGELRAALRKLRQWNTYAAWSGVE